MSLARGFRHSGFQAAEWSLLLALRLNPFVTTASTKGSRRADS
jgi:hypothetical protein